ncbi:MAG: ROK family protein [Erysipelotrichaceae bacterium]
MILGAIEAGGTKFVVAIGNENGNIIDRISFPTTTPQETINKVIDYFSDKKIEALGLASFGPIDLNKESKTYGCFTNTPKIGWSDFNIVEALQKALNIPIGFDTDVNGAALAEAVIGDSKHLNSVLYLTVGTGIGGGLILDKKPIHGLSHPEMGHVRVNVRFDDSYRGNCPYHHNCVESLAAGPSIEKRWGQKANSLSTQHPAWDLEAYYLSQAICSYILILSPERIILGGGVMKQKQLFPLIHKYVREGLNNYLASEMIDSDKIEEYIISPSLADDSGIIGALILARREINYEAV